MRLQQLREGQQYLTRTGQLLTVVSINEEPIGSDTFMVYFEQGGVISSIDATNFRLQVHNLVKDVRACKHLISKEELAKNQQLRYEHGELWLDEQNKYWMVLRSLRSNSSGVSLIPVDPDNGLLPTQQLADVQTTKTVNLQFKASEQFDTQITEILHKGEVLPVLEFNAHSITTQTSDLETGELFEPVKVGFGTALAWDSSCYENPDCDDLADAIWGLGLQDPKVQQLLYKIEYDMTASRWRL